MMNKQTIRDTFTLTASILGAHDHAGTLLGERYLQDAIRQNAQRLRAKGLDAGVTLGDGAW